MSVLVLTEICAVVGLDLSVKTYPGGRPLRDARHAKLLAAFRELLHHSLRWSVDVPLPLPGDRRAWDALIHGQGWRYGVEAETNPIDGQALTRRLKLKQRDGMVDGVILLVRDTRQARHFRSQHSDLLSSYFPIPGRRAVEALAAGLEPRGSAIVVL